MPQLKDALPKISVRLFKTISRQMIDGQVAVSDRYQSRADFIDLTPFLGDGSSVVTSKSVREPAGAFSISFADGPVRTEFNNWQDLPELAMETVYGLVEPMDIIEIRMWGGIGPQPAVLPIKMRGFVSEIGRSQAMSPEGKPTRTVSIGGQDYGKLWQIYQILYLQAYAAGNPLLTNYSLWELFGVTAQNTMSSSEFVRVAIEKIMNPYIEGFMPENSMMPREIKVDATVSHGVVNNSYQGQEGAVFDLLKTFGDVGVWNELYTEDRESGVYAVYRPTPALHLNGPPGNGSRKIQQDSPDPVYVVVADEDIQSISSQRSDSNVANFYWVSNQRFDMISDIFRKLLSLTPDDGSVNLRDYPNASARYYGVRPMYGATEQGEDLVTSLTSGLDKDGQDARTVLLEEWITNRRRIMLEMNKDNVAFESGSARIKGGLMRPPKKDGELEHMKAGDYARFKQGAVEHEAYIVKLTDEYIPFQSYTATIEYERGTGFAERVRMEGGKSSPWLAEQATRKDTQ